MNTAESLTLCRYVKAACPQQAFDEYTPDAWHDLLGDLRFIDCKDAARTITQRQPFCAPAEIRTEVRRIRAERIMAAEHMVSPPAGCDDYMGWLADMRRRAGDGDFEPEALELTQRDMRLLEGVFPEPPKPRYLPNGETIAAMRREVVGKRPPTVDRTAQAVTDTPLPEEIA